MISKKTLNDRLTKTVNKPRLAFENGWYESVDFCRGFFDRCEHRILSKAPDMLSLAHRAAEMAEANGDPHLKNLSRGVLVHAFIADSLFFWANTTLESYRGAALACCRRCGADFYLRAGDLLGEMRRPKEAIEALDACLKICGADVEADFLGRVYFLRAVAHHFEGHRALALEDAGAALKYFSLDSPRGFFLDTIAFIAIFLGDDDPSHDELALVQLSRFRERIKRKNEWSDTRARLCWVEAQVFARLGDIRRARTHMDQAVVKIVPNGLAREAVAVVLDACQLRLRHENPRPADVRIAQRLLNRCLDQRSDLDPKHVKALKKLDQVLERKPENAFREIGALRASFVVPVPNRMTLFSGSV